MADGNTVTTIPANLVVLRESVAHAPAEKQPVAAVVLGKAVPDHRALGSTPRMQPKISVPLDDAVKDLYVVRLLQTNPVPIIVADGAILNDGAITPIEVNAAPAAAIDEKHVSPFIAFDGKALYSEILDVVRADDGVNRRGKRAVHHQTIRIKRSADGEVIALAVENRAARAVERLHLL